MNVVSLTACYPSTATPNAGLFVQRRLASLNELDPVRIINVVPTPLWYNLRGGISRSQGPPRTWHVPFAYVPFISRPMNPLLYARAVFPLLSSLVKRGSVDVIDAHFSWPDGVAAARIARVLGVPFTVTLRGVLGRYLGDPLVRGSVIRSLRAAAGVIAVSRHLGDLAVRIGVSPERVRVVPNGVDAEKFCPGDRDGARRALGRSADETLLVTVGHLCRRKGVHRVLRILPELIRARGDVRYVVIGADGGEGRFESRLMRLVRQSGLGSFVTFTGNLGATRVALWLQAADLFVLPTGNEGCCNAVTEALATGLPVVTTDVGGNREVVAPDCGSIVPPGDDGALLKAIIDTLARRADCAEAARSRGRRAWATVGAETSAALHDAVLRGPAPGVASVAVVR